MRLPALFGTGGPHHEQRLAHTLRTVPLFRDVPAADLAAIWRRFSEIDVPAGTVLCRRDDIGDRFYIIRRGSAAVSLGLGPKSTVVRQFGPGDFFGEMSLFTGQPRSADVVVTEEATIWVLERADFDEVMTRSIPVLRSVIAALCQRLEQTTRLLEDHRATAHERDTGMRFGPYRVVEQLGAGGMAAVYSAVHVSTETAAAVKVLPAAWGASPDLQKRLRQEAAALQRVRHPNVIRVLEVGEVEKRLGGGYYLAMEQLPNALNRALKAQYPEPFAPATALRIARGVSDGLGAVHAVGLIHRDVKPSNILLRSDGSPVLTDFGLVAALKDVAHLHRLTPPDVLMGSSDYIAPEQVAGDTVDARSDLYSLGIVLYELLSGSVPFAGRTPLETLRAHSEEPPPPLPSHVPPLTRAVIERLLQKDPRDRFSCAADLSEALARAWNEARQEDPGAEQRTYVRTAMRGRRPTGIVTPREELRWQLDWWNESHWLPVDCALVDIGQGGLGVLCPDPPVVGSRVRITFVADAPVADAPDSTVVEISGHVIYEASVEIGIGVPTYRCGIAFDQPQPRLSGLLSPAEAVTAVR